MCALCDTQYRQCTSARTNMEHLVTSSVKTVIAMVSMAACQPLLEAVPNPTSIKHPCLATSDSHNHCSNYMRSEQVGKRLYMAFLSFLQCVQSYLVALQACMPTCGHTWSGQRVASWPTETPQQPPHTPGHHNLLPRAPAAAA